MIIREYEVEVHRYGVTGYDFIYSFTLKTADIALDISRMYPSSEGYLVYYEEV